MKTKQVNLIPKQPTNILTISSIIQLSLMQISKNITLDSEHNILMSLLYEYYMKKYLLHE